MKDSIFISYSIGDNPEEYDQQFDLPVETDLVRVFAGAAAFPAEIVFNQDICEVTE